MIPPDSNISRQLAREHQERLRQDWQWTNPARPDVVESRRRAPRFGFAWLRLGWLRAHVRPARRYPTG